MARGKRADLAESMNRLLCKRANEDNRKNAESLGLKCAKNSDVVAAALFNKAAKGEVSAIKEVRDLAATATGEKAELSRLYDALTAEE